jgi:hypothetical protein
MQMPQDTLFGFSIQQGSGANDYAKMADGYNEPDLTNLYYFPLTDSSMGITKQQTALPDEIGGKAMTFGSYVTGVWGGGTASLIARLENRLGWLLLATMGEVSTVANTKAEDLSICGGSSGTTSGVHSHIFFFSDDDEFFAPWLTVFRKLPHATAAEEVGERMQDARIGTFTMNAASGAPVGIDLGIVGRRLQASEEFDLNPGWSSTYDDFTTFAVGTCDGHFKIEGTEHDVTNVTLNINNNVLPPQQSIILGSVDPKDFPLLSRTVTVTATILVENYDLYVSTFAGSSIDVSGGTDQTAACTVYKGDLDVMVASQVAIGAAGDATEKYKLRIVSNRDNDNVAWNVQPIRTVPRRPVVLQVTGTVEAVSGETGFYVVLQNAQADYNLP